LIDLTVIHPQRTDLLERCKGKQYAAAEQAEALKATKYRDKARSRNMLFTTAALEVFGASGNELRILLDRLAKKACSEAPSSMDLKKEGFVAYWQQALSICLQKSISTSLYNFSNYIRSGERNPTANLTYCIPGIHNHFLRH
jgi:hypothetical protein